MRRGARAALKWAAAAAVLAGLFAGAWLVNGLAHRDKAAEGDAVDVPRRASGGVVKLGARLAESHGLQDGPARAVSWRRRVVAYGRLVPNPRAAAELRAPFAGTLRADPDGAWPAPGRRVRAGQRLARLEARVGPQELLDLRVKAADARARRDGAEEVARLLGERVRRLKPSPTAPALAQGDLDEALVKLGEAKAQATAARAAAEQWQTALEALERPGGPGGVWSVPLLAPADGDLTEVAAGPGGAVGADAVLARVVDHRRALARLDLPPEALSGGAPELAELTAPPSDGPPLGGTDPPRADGPAVPAVLLGVAGQVDAVSQLTACWYEAADAPPGWRPNLFVQARLPAPGPARDAVAVPLAAVYHQGRALVYVRLGDRPGRYERREVVVLAVEGDDAILARGVNDGEPVVFRQAQVLLSEEFRGDIDNDWTPPPLRLWRLLPSGGRPRLPEDNALCGPLSPGAPAMLQALVSWSVRQRAVALALAALLLLGGLYAARTARLDVFPEFAPPQVVIQAEAPGLSPLEVEQLVTGPVEQAVNGVPRLDVLRSQSVQGLSVVTVIFQDGTDIYRARQLVTERLAEVAGQLPAGAQPPRLAPLTSSTGGLLTVGFTSAKLSPLALRDRVQYLVRPRLLAVGGVAQVTLFGGEVRQLQVQIDPDRLAARGLSCADVAEAARQATGVRGAGFVENEAQRLNLRVEAQALTAEELGERLLTPTEGAPVRLADVARVTDAAEPKFGDAAIDGEPGVVLVAAKQLDADTLDVTRRLEEELERLRPQLEREGIRYHPALFRQANFIEVAIGNVLSSLLLGAALVAAVLFAFLFNLRTAFISLLAIPLSLLAAVVLLRWLGVGLNTLTLGGLAIAVGEVVDDAIIDVENIFRRLRENALVESPRPAAAVVLGASLEVRGAVVFATFIVALVFLPVFFLSGLQGRLFAPLGLAYVLAVLASLLVAVTVTPALSLLLLPGAGGAAEPPPLRWLQGGYERLLRRLDGNFALLAVLTLVLLGAAGWALAGFGGELLPELRESHYVVHMRMVPGTSLPQSLQTGRQVALALKEEPAVRSVAQQAGRAELGEDTWGVEYSELEVDLERLDAEGAERVERALKGALKGRAGCSFEVLPFLTERIKETVSGSPAALAVKLYGDDLAALDRAAADVAKELAAVPGAVGVRAEAQTGAPEVVIRPRSAARRGVRAGQLLEAVHAAFQGAEVAQVYDRNRVVPVVVKLPPRLRRDPQAVGDLWLSVAGRPAADADVAGPPGRLRLRDVAEVYLSDGRFLVAHEGGLRRQVVTCNVQGRDVASFAAEAERRLARLPLPDGVTLRVTGEHAARRAAQRELLGLALAAGAGIVLLLWLALGTARRLLLALANLPFALVGGVAAVYLAGGVINVGALIGFVTLFGITVRNGIMMASHWRHLHEVEGLPWGPELVFRGARERLAPVLMTALVTGLGLLPIAVGSGAAGREIEGPMAQVILGGLATSTALNLLLLPLLYLRLGEAAAPRAQPART